MIQIISVSRLEKIVLLLVAILQLASAVRGNEDSFGDDEDRNFWKLQIGQMVQMDISMLLTTTEPIQFDQDLLDEYIGERGVGSVLNNHYLWKAADYRREVIRMQQTALKYNRPPVIWGLDSVHGANYVLDAVVTPQPINLASSFNKSLAFEAGMLASRDTRRAGIPWLFSPLLGLSWNPFWSRVYETFGEDPLLVGDMSASMINGIQLSNNHLDIDGLLPSLAAASAKHFLGYSNPHNGHDRAPSSIPMRHLYQHFMLPWRKALLESKSVESKPMTVMESYTEIDGVPNVANRRTLDKILRKELKYQDGMVVTDYNEITNLERWHHIAKDTKGAVLAAMVEGTIDMSMIGNLNDVHSFFDAMEDLLAVDDDENNTPLIQTFRERVRKSVGNVMKLKRDLNMFEESFRLEPLPEDEESGYPTKEDLEMVLEMTRQSIVLAKNQKNTLPLIKARPVSDDPTVPLKLLVTGPTIDSISFQTGGWTGEWQGVNSNKEREWFTSTQYKTVLEALEDERDFFTVKHECGVDIMGNHCSDDLEDNDSKENKNLLDMVRGWIHGNNDTPGSSASDSFDAIVVCLGEENYAEKPGDIVDLRLPQGQYDLVKALSEARMPDTKIVLVYFGGRPRLLADVVPFVDAVIVGFLPGPFAGNVIADFLTGRISPSARLPLTYPKHQDLSGVPYLHEVSDMCTKDTGGTLPHWENVPCDVQWPFGHGLSYTEFIYTDLNLSTNTLIQHLHDGEENAIINHDEQLTVTVTVTNAGNMAGAETVLFFSFDQFRSTSPEYKRLRGYEKVWLEPGESKDVSIKISLQDDLRFVGPHDDSHYILQDGLEFRIGIGSDSNCRSNLDAEKNVCSDVVTIQTQRGYIGACEAACNVWKESGGHCAKNTFSPKATGIGAVMDVCRNMCASADDFTKNGANLNDADGWGWNYVECLQAIVWNGSFDSESDCWKLTSLCRDVTQTIGMDEFGDSYSWSGALSANGTNAGATPLAIAIAMVAMAFASFMIVRAIRAGFSNNTSAQTYRGTRSKNFINVEFSAVRSSEERNHDVDLTL